MFLKEAEPQNKKVNFIWKNKASLSSKVKMVGVEWGLCGLVPSRALSNLASSFLCAPWNKDIKGKPKKPW